MSDSLRPHGLWLPRLLCPGNSPGKNTRVGCQSRPWGPSWPRDWTGLSCTAGRLFTVQGTRATTTESSRLCPSRPQLSAWRLAGLSRLRPSCSPSAGPRWLAWGRHSGPQPRPASRKNATLSSGHATEQSQATPWNHTGIQPPLGHKQGGIWTHCSYC